MPPSQTTPPNIVAWFAIGISFISVIVSISGWFVIHWLTIRREQKRDRELEAKARASGIASRKRDFRTFLKRWRSEIWNVKPDGNYDVPAIAAYKNRIPDFHAELERVRDCLTAEQYALAERLGTLKKEDWENKQARDFILEVIDELIEFAA